MARYGTVLVCGFIERSVEIIIIDKVRKKAHPRVLRFVKTHLNRGANYECEAIAQILERFDVDWARNFRTFMKTRDDLVQSMASAYALRNSIAHGGTANRGIHGVNDLYLAASAVIEGMLAATR